MTWLIPDEHIEQVEAAREIVLRRLDHSPAPRAALAELLHRRDVDPRVSEEVLDRLEAAGVIDDAAYAAMVARTRFAEKGTARRGIAEELRRKGLGDAAIAQALAQVSDSDEVEAARHLALKKMRTTGHLDPQVRRRRTLAFLTRKGYTAEVCLASYEEALREFEADR